MKKDNIKALKETRAEKVKELEMMYAKLEAEQRAITEEEEKQIEAISDEIENIDKTMAILQRMKERLVQTNKGKEEVIRDVRDGDMVGGNRAEERAQKEERAFEQFLRGQITSERAENLTFSDNGAVVPTTISQRIIKLVYDICPILERSTKYNVKGNLEIPYYPQTPSTDITMAYATEFTDLESSAGTFSNIQSTTSFRVAL